MQLNKLYRRIIQFLTENNKEKKFLIIENKNLQIKQNCANKNILHMQYQLCEAQNDIFRAKNKNFELKIENEILRRKLIGKGGSDE